MTTPSLYELLLQAETNPDDVDQIFEQIYVLYPEAKEEDQQAAEYDGAKLAIRLQPDGLKRAN